MGTLADLINNTKSALAARIGSVLLARPFGSAETTSDLVSLKAGASGGLAIEGVAGGTAVPISGTVTATVDVSTLATQTTLAAILAKIIAAPATEALQTAGNLLLGASRTSTAPNVTTATQRLLEIARDGSLRVNADLYDFVCQTQFVVSTAAQQVAYVRAGSNPTYPFDGLWSNTDAVIVYGQPRGRAWCLPDGLTFASASAWTIAGTDWTIAASKATHAASAGGTDVLVPSAYGVAPRVGDTYLVYLSVVHRGGTGLTPHLGSAAGTAIASTLQCVQVLTCAATATADLTASDDWDGDVLAWAVIPHTPVLTAKSYMPFALVEAWGVAAAATPTTLIAAATSQIHGLYRRAPGSVDLG